MSNNLFNIDELEKCEEKVVKFVAKIKSCSLCLFANELTDICNDLIGYKCSISNNEISINDEDWKIPKTCPILKCRHIIEIKIEK